MFICYYPMDVSGHKIEDCWALRHKIQDLIDEGVIIIDLPNQKYEINNRPKAYHANHLDPPLQILSSSEIPDRVIPESKADRKSTQTSLRSLNKPSPNQSSSQAARGMSQQIRKSEKGTRVAKKRRSWEGK